MLDIYLPILLLPQITYQPVEYAAVFQLQKRILPVVSNFKKNHHDSISEIFHKTSLNECVHKMQYRKYMFTTMFSNKIQNIVVHSYVYSSVCQTSSQSWILFCKGKNCVYSV